MKKPIFENFSNNYSAFELAQNHWRKIIERTLKSQNKTVALKELNEKVLFHRDGNPIYYQHFPSLNKSIRIIQEEVRYESCPHLGGWVEPASEQRDYDELVISVELTQASAKYVNQIIYMWFTNDFTLTLMESRLDSILDRHIDSYKKNKPSRPRGPSF